MQVVGELGVAPVEAGLFVADALDRGAGGGLDLVQGSGRPTAIGVEHALAADFAGQDDAVGGGQGLAGHAGLRILGQEQIDDGVGDLVGDLVRMPFGDGLGREQVIATRHFGFLWSFEFGGQAGSA